MNEKKYECKRCFYKCIQLNDMKKHLNKKNKCIRTIESFDYKDEDIYDLSLIKIEKVIDKINDNFEYDCLYCNKKFLTKSNLNRHIKQNCKRKNHNVSSQINLNSENNLEINFNPNFANNIYIEKNIEHTNLHTNQHTNEHTNLNTNEHTNLNTNEHTNLHTNEHTNLNTNQHTNLHTNEHTNLHTNEYTNLHTNGHTKEHTNDYTNNSSTDNIPNLNNSNIHITNVTTNNILNNINFNIQIINSFDKNWSTEHLDEKTKLILLLNQSKFTSTLENILDNDVNLNVLIDNTSDNGLVYNENKVSNMKLKDIFKVTMDKLYQQLCKFNDEISNPNILNINTEIIKN